MTCSESERVMSALLDGDLETSPRLEAHIAECAGCRELWEALTATVGVLSLLEEPEGGDDLTARVMAALPAPASSARRLGLTFGLTAVCLASSLIGVRLWLSGLLPYVLGEWAAFASYGIGEAARQLDRLGFGSAGFLANLVVLGALAAMGLLLAAGGARAAVAASVALGRGKRT